MDNTTDINANDVINDAEELVKELDALSLKREEEKKIVLAAKKRTFLTNFDEPAGDSLLAKKDLNDGIAAETLDNERVITTQVLDDDESKSVITVKGETLAVEEDAYKENAESVEGNSSNSNNGTKSGTETNALVANDEDAAVEKNNEMLMKLDREKQLLMDEMEVIDGLLASDTYIKYAENNDEIFKSDQEIDTLLKEYERNREAINNNVQHREEKTNLSSGETSKKHRTFGDLLREKDGNYILKDENSITTDEEESFSTISSDQLARNEGNEEQTAFLTSESMSKEKKEEEEIEKEKERQAKKAKKRQEKQEFAELFNRALEKYGKDEELQRKSKEIDKKLAEMQSLLAVEMPVTGNFVRGLENRLETKRIYDQETGEENEVKTNNYVLKLYKPAVSKDTEKIWNRYFDIRDNTNVSNLENEIKLTVGNVSDKGYKDYIREQRRDRQIEETIGKIDKVINDIKISREIAPLTERELGLFETEFFTSPANAEIVTRLRLANKSDTGTDNAMEDNTIVDEDIGAESEIFKAMSSEDQMKFKALLEQYSQQAEAYAENNESRSEGWKYIIPEADSNTEAVEGGEEEKNSFYENNSIQSDGIEEKDGKSEKKSPYHCAIGTDSQSSKQLKEISLAIDEKCNKNEEFKKQESEKMKQGNNLATAKSTAAIANDEDNNRIRTSNYNLIEEQLEQMLSSSSSVLESFEEDYRIACQNNNGVQQPDKKKDYKTVFNRVSSKSNKRGQALSCSEKKSTGSANINNSSINTAINSSRIDKDIEDIMKNTESIEVSMEGQLNLKYITKKEEASIANRIKQEYGKEASMNSQKSDQKKVIGDKNKQISSSDPKKNLSRQTIQQVASTRQMEKDSTYPRSGKLQTPLHSIQGEQSRPVTSKDDKLNKLPTKEAKPQSRSITRPINIETKNLTNETASQSKKAVIDKSKPQQPLSRQSGRPMSGKVPNQLPKITGL